jgi:3,4-dihydroxy 2-butanone 4-phosphate synthase/GTP cyclohydrolase II
MNVAEARAAAAVEAGATTLQRGRPAVLVDDMSEHPHGYLVLAAETATAETVTFLIRHTSGLLCVALPESRADRLHLPAMVRLPDDGPAAGFAVSVDARHGGSTGISAGDRARTLRLLASDGTHADDLTRPGHVLPVRIAADADPSRPTAPAAALELMRYADREPAAALCALVSTLQPNELAGAEESGRFARYQGLPLITLRQVVERRQRDAAPLVRAAQARLPLRGAEFTAIGYRSAVDEREHLAFVLGDLVDSEIGPARPGPIEVRVHRECLLGDAFGSLTCRCGERLQASLAEIVTRGRGVILYLREEPGRGLLRSLAGADCAARGGFADTEASALVHAMLSDLGVPAVVPDRERVAIG